MLNCNNSKIKRWIKSLTQHMLRVWSNVKKLKQSLNLSWSNNRPLVRSKKNNAVILLISIISTKKKTPRPLKWAGSWTTAFTLRSSKTAINAASSSVKKKSCLACRKTSPNTLLSVQFASKVSFQNLKFSPKSRPSSSLKASVAWHSRCSRQSSSTKNSLIHWTKKASKSWWAIVSLRTTQSCTGI